MPYQTKTKQQHQKTQKINNTILQYFIQKQN